MIHISALVWSRMGDGAPQVEGESMWPGRDYDPSKHFVHVYTSSR